MLARHDALLLAVRIFSQPIRALVVISSADNISVNNTSMVDLPKASRSIVLAEKINAMPVDLNPTKMIDSLASQTPKFATLPFVAY
jgi:hypothetical protein